MAICTLNTHAIVCWAGTKVMLLVISLTIADWQEQLHHTLSTYYLCKATLYMPGHKVVWLDLAE